MKMILKENYYKIKRKTDANVEIYFHIQNMKNSLQNVYWTNKKWNLT